MNLNKNNWFARYYNWMHGNFPNDVCTFFWRSLFAILLAPIVVPGRIVVGRQELFIGKFVIGIILWLFSVIITKVGQVLIGDYSQDLNVFVKFILYFSTGLLLVSIFIGVCIGIYFLCKKIKDKRDEKPYNPDYKSFAEKTGDFIGAIRGKYCTKITWK